MNSQVKRTIVKVILIFVIFYLQFTTSSNTFQDFYNIHTKPTRNRQFHCHISEPLPTYFSTHNKPRTQTYIYVYSNPIIQKTCPKAFSPNIFFVSVTYLV